MDERELPGYDPTPDNMDGGLPHPGCAPDPEWDAYVAWHDREIAEGRGERPPEPWEIESSAVSLSLGDAANVDPAMLAAVCGPEGLGGDGLGPQFGQDAAAPGCQAQAVHADLDRTTPYPEGSTDECNLGPKCRTHHRAKQTPGWKVEQPEPGVFRWPSPPAAVTPPAPAPTEPEGWWSRASLTEFSNSWWTSGRLGRESRPRPRGRVRCGDPRLRDRT